jgi:hypothetical protein
MIGIKIRYGVYLSLNIVMCKDGDKKETALVVAKKERKKKGHLGVGC